MRPIPQSIRRQLKQEPCFICKQPATEKHHSLIYSGKQVNELFAILSLCSHCHRGNSGTIFQDVREKCEMKAISDGLRDLLIKYPKFDWCQRLKYLDKKYGRK